MIEFLETRALPLNFKEVDEVLKELLTIWDPGQRYYDGPTLELLATFHEHIQQFVEIEGLQSYQPMLSEGTTGAFATFYLLNSHKQLLVLPGEYPYHQQVFSSLGRPISVWDKTKPPQDSYLILSQPFSGDGNVSQNLETILELCEKWSIDVLLDLSFFALTSKRIEIPDMPCIKAIAFSLSKVFDVGNLRIGLTYWKSEIKTPQHVLREWQYENHLGSYIALGLLERISMKALQLRAEVLQRSICAQLGLDPSDSYLFGLSQNPQWKKFYRREGLARVCISRLIGQRLALNEKDSCPP